MTVTVHQKMYLVALTLSITILNAEASFKDKFMNIKNKASKFYKNKSGKDKTWHFLGQDPTEYPGTNEKYLKMNQDKWDTYYECLNVQNNNLGDQLSITPEAVVAFEGSMVKFECGNCISPQEQEKADEIVWHWASDVGKHLEPVQFTEHIYESPEDKILHLFNLQMENTGQYVCSIGESQTAPHFLTVVALSDNETTEVHSPETPLGPYPKEPEIIQDTNLVIDTEWGQWSTCSKCDAIGKKHKLGYCTIYSADYYSKVVPLSARNETESSSVKNNEVPIKEVDIELFRIFKYGIPCNSHILPKSIKKHHQVKKRKHEIMIGYCQIKCPKNKVFVVKDRNGKVIEEANNSAGIYSLTQSLPPMEPPIERRLQYGVKGKTIIVTCPGSMDSDTPIQWQEGNKNIIPEIIAKESSGRVFISITDKIHIRRARLSDSSVYSCWQQNELVGTVRLLVEKKFQLDFTHHLMLLGVILVLSTFLYVFVKAFFGRKYAKT